MFEPGAFMQTRENLKLNIGILCFMSGKLPSEIFEDENWLPNFLFNLKIANVFWDAYQRVHGGAR